MNWINTGVDFKLGLQYVMQPGMWYRHDPDCQSVIAQEPGPIDFPYEQKQETGG